MAYAQVKDILDRAVQIRKFVGAYAARQERQAADDLLAGLFQAVNKHYQELEGMVTEYRGKSSEGLLETWLQYPGLEELDESMERLSDIATQDDLAVVQQLLTAEQTVRDVYRQVESQTNMQDLKELFGNLIELQDHHLRNIADCASELEQERRS